MNDQGRRQAQYKISEAKWTTQALWFVVLFAGLLASLGGSWALHKPVDYGYAFWYQQMDIGPHIDRYGPKNRYIRGFDQVSSEEHIALFGGIVESVHDHGRGLDKLSFVDGRGRTKTLLREPEVVHLQDVANLIDVLTYAAIVALIIAAVGTEMLVRWRIRIRWRLQAMLLGGFLAGLGLITVLVGPKDVFYQLHIWVFPEDHQWFFYYQDSLMSTMMKAPDLFGGIAVTLVAGGLVIFLLYIAFLKRQLPED
jgi:hypothetical protein